MVGKGKTLLEILAVSLKLGLTSFGGPIAHIGYFRDEYVKRRKWLDDSSFADLTALCQFLPGPASSQLGMGIGMLRGGLLGGIVSFIGFTLPSALALALFGLLSQGLNLDESGWLHGLKLVAVAIVAQAIWGMGQKLTPDASRMTIAIVAAALVLLYPLQYVGIIIIVLAAIVGLLVPLSRNQEVSTMNAHTDSTAASTKRLSIRIPRSVMVVCFSLFASLFILLPIIQQWLGTNLIMLMFDSFYRSGSLVFGGGHVVLPMLENEVVPRGWVSEEQFLAGYGAAQAVPGPLFTFAAYLGAITNGWLGALVATIAIFLPSYLILAGVLPYWKQIRGNQTIQRALLAVNAAVVGLLLAAFYNPIWTSTIMSSSDFVVASILFVLLVYWKLPPWLVVIIGASAGMLLAWMI